MQNPIRKLAETMSYQQLADKTGFTRGYLHILSKYTSERMGRLQIGTVLDLQEKLNIDLVTYIKSN